MRCFFDRCGGEGLAECGPLLQRDPFEVLHAGLEAAAAGVWRVGIEGRAESADCVLGPC
jgi:hypothetical protein